MPAETFTYTMKNLDRSLWQRLKAQASLEGLSVKALIERLVTDYLKKAR